jgi:hydroxybutyrate-dimer hydrolase
MTTETLTQPDTVITRSALTHVATSLRPSFIRGEILQAHYDDLLTAGLGREELERLTAETLPRFASSPLATPEELRRNAILASHLGLIDRTQGAGYGTLYGPGVIDGKPVGDGKVPGEEYLVYAADLDDPGAVVTLLVQVPDAFDLDRPCIIAAPSSGSRGIYGGVAAAGEWALQHGCAVAYTDKGTGIGVHDLDPDIAYLINGEHADATAIGQAAHFRVTPEERLALLGSHRLAFKHAHSKRNVETHWGQDVLHAIEFAFFVLNLKYKRFEQGRPFTRRDVTVIASNISNGGGASMRAAEQDILGWIDGIVVAEPSVQPKDDLRFEIRDGVGPSNPEGNLVPLHSRPLLDYMSFLAVYQPALFDRDWRQELVRKGLLAGETEADQIADAQAKIQAYGILREQNDLQFSHNLTQIPLGVTVTYANAYGRFSVADNLCGYGFAVIGENGAPVPLRDTAELPGHVLLFTTGNGIPPVRLTGFPPPSPAAAGDTEDAAAAAATPTWVADVGLVLGDPATGEVRRMVAEQVEAALKLRRIVIGTDLPVEKKLSPEEIEQHLRVANGMQAIRMSANLRGKPAIIVQGRADGVVAPNHTGRAYYARNQLVEQGSSNLRYYEVTNAHHLDAFNPLFPGYAERYISLHYYFLQALTLMRDHLDRTKRRPLPPSQVIATLPRGVDPTTGQPNPIRLDNLPSISDHPGPNEIKFAGERLIIPEGQPPVASAASPSGA